MVLLGGLRCACHIMDIFLMHKRSQSIYLLLLNTFPCSNLRDIRVFNSWVYNYEIKEKSPNLQRIKIVNVMAMIQHRFSAKPLRGRLAGVA